LVAPSEIFEAADISAIFSLAIEKGLTILLLVLAFYYSFFNVWLRPDLPQAVSFARWAVCARDVTEESIADSCFVGVAWSSHYKHISRGSDLVGFLHLLDKTCLLHLHDQDILIPRGELRELTRVRSKFDLLAWGRMYVIGLTWSPADEPYPQTLYLIAWGGETVFAIRRATDRLYEQLSAWKLPQPDVDKVSVAVKHGTPS
jgi:hypothetical protein